MKRQRVITYQAAYDAPDITVCARHEDRPPYPLGSVSHGQHWGHCDECMHEAKGEVA